MLVPTLSDPATRPDKERTTNKKRNNRTQGNDTYELSFSYIEHCLEETKNHIDTIFIILHYIVIRQAIYNHIKLQENYEIRIFVVS